MCDDVSRLAARMRTLMMSLSPTVQFVPPPLDGANHMGTISKGRIASTEESVVSKVFPQLAEHVALLCVSAVVL